MKISTIALIIYFGLTLFWKLYADYTNDYWVNAYWFYSSVFYCVVFYELSKQFFFKIRAYIWKIGACYWGVMALLHLYLFFNITLYTSFVKSANKITVGASFILIIIVLATFKALKNDYKHER